MFPVMVPRGSTSSNTIDGDRVRDSLDENNSLRCTETVRKPYGNLRKQIIYAGFPFGNFKFLRVYAVRKLRLSPIPGCLRSAETCGNLRFTKRGNYS